MYGLNPATGKLLWKNHITGIDQQKPLMGPERLRRAVTGRTGGPVRGTSFVNDLLSSNGKHICFSARIYDLQTGKQVYSYGAGFNKLEGFVTCHPRHTTPVHMLFENRHRAQSSKYPRYQYYLRFPYRAMAFGGSYWSRILTIGDSEVFSSAGPWIITKTNSPWKTKVLQEPNALVLAGDQLIAAGPSPTKEKSAGTITFYSKKDAKVMGEIGISASPVFEGMAVAYKRVYIASQDGKIICLGGK